MRARILAIARWSLLIWGAISLVGVVIFAVLSVRAVSQFGSNKIDSASPSDVRFVLNWCQLGDQRIEKVLHSHVSSRSFTGDYLDAYAIRISHIDVAELTKQTDEFTGRWYRGDQLPQIVGDAVDFVDGSLHEVPWFPTKEQLLSSEYYVYPWSIYCHGVRPTAVELIFIRPSDKMVFYFGSKI
jgi:hypothetical protein